MEFIDLKQQYRRVQDQVEQRVLRAMRSGQYIMGDEVFTLERRLADFAGVKHCICCSNGTDALSIALMALGIGEGDAVFVPSFTFFATAEVAALRGATPVFVDIDPDTYNIDAADLRRKIDRATQAGGLTPRAVIPVDLFGLPADYDAVEAVAQEYGLFVVEDAAQGFGGVYHGKRGGSFGACAAASFFPAKPLGCYGDGGAVFTDDDALAETMRSIRVHGKGSGKYDNVRIGLNARLDTVQAAVLHCKLDIFEDEIVSRHRIAQMYTRMLRDVVITPKVPQGCESVYAQYTIRLKDHQTREHVMRELKARGIPSFVYYPKPMHLQSAFRSYGCQAGECPVSELASDTVLSLPMHPYLTEEETAFIAQAVRRAVLDA
ncbi:DegT/DnrJ/EryC1/StrS family aminotransferase [Candidatus Soleaferrea massiliensis]|uniref:DegT/DnrJ/EryC1/StrS family aminotransferase n=1 Tax=Candidatus Soleaferrea massiliensis TaxID=1470354 RepID=UPI00058F6955|nr:DegT/DnrJ/EryC1/StrS aminotransferase family protein [Candidatus Soleaferrea massiliensis]